MSLKMTMVRFMRLRSMHRLRPCSAMLDPGAVLSPQRKARDAEVEARRKEHMHTVPRVCAYTYEWRS